MPKFSKTNVYFQRRKFEWLILKYIECYLLCSRGLAQRRRLQHHHYNDTYVLGKRTKTYVQYTHTTVYAGSGNIPGLAIDVKYIRFELWRTSALIYTITASGLADTDRSTFSITPDSTRLDDLTQHRVSGLAGREHSCTIVGSSMSTTPI